MTMAAVRITTSTREQPRKVAEETGKSMQVLMGEAVAAYRRRLPGVAAAITDVDPAEVAEAQMALVGELHGIPKWEPFRGNV